MTEEHIRRVVVNKLWYHPFFGPMMTLVKFVPDENVPTMGITSDIEIRYNPTFTSKLSEEELAGVIFHEIMHPMTKYFERRESRDHTFWNMAHDMAINQFLRHCHINLPNGCLYPPDEVAETTAEEIYDFISKDPKYQKMAKQLKQNGYAGPGQGCGMEGDGGQPGSEQNKAVEQASRAGAELARGVGKGNEFSKILGDKPAAVTWSSLIRSTLSRALAANGKDLQTYQKRSRRSAGDLILPGWKSSKAVISVVIDSSGSVSDEMLAAAISELMCAARVASNKIYLVVHDHGVQWKGWVDGSKREQVTKRMIGRGGTDFQEAYRAVQDMRHRFDTMIHFTDGEVGHWPEGPTNCRKHVAAILIRGYNGSSRVPDKWDRVIVEV